MKPAVLSKDVLMPSPITALALVNPGFEEIAFKNIAVYAPITNPSRIPEEKGMITFQTNSLMDLCRITYRSQIINQLFILLEKISYTTEDDLAAQLQDRIAKNKHIATCFTPASAFRVYCRSKVLDNQELERHIGKCIDENLAAQGISLEIDLKHPDIAVYCIASNRAPSSGTQHHQAYLCIDFSGDLAKRDYRVFNSSQSLRGTTAFGLLALAGYHPKDSLLDPFANSGTLAIEAVLFANNISHRQYHKTFPFMKLALLSGTDWDAFFAKEDKAQKDIDPPITAADPLLRNITAANKNAKIAGVEKYLHFRRIDIDWHDVKFEKSGFDKIITFIPGSSKHKHDALLDKQFKEFFYQAEYIIKPEGSVVVLCITAKQLLAAAEEHFELADEKTIYSGEQEMRVLFFKRKGKPSTAPDTA